MKLRIVLQTLLLLSMIFLSKANSNGLCAPNQVPIDPEQCMYTDGIIAKWGYPVENHYVVTEDGYILRVFRIPASHTSVAEGKGRPVLLNHGLMGSSDTWVANLPHESLAFMLADRGYDVWMANNRGNSYARNHTVLNPDHSQAFWRFSLDEMASRDLPASIEYILKTNERHDKIDYVAHSQGTSIGFAFFSSNPHYSASKVRCFYALAPVTAVAHTSSPFQVLAQKGIISALSYSLNTLHIYEFGTGGPIESEIAKLLCDSQSYVPKYICKNVLLWFEDFNPKYTNSTRMPVYLTHKDAGTSWRDIEHWAQLISSGQFETFNYGPLYPLESLTVPTVLFSGGVDALADPEDVENLMQRISGALRSHFFYPDFMHLDFTFGLGAFTQVYPTMFDLMKQDN